MEKWQASPPGALDELIDEDTRFMTVSLGRRYASNRLRLISCAKRLRRRGRLSASSKIGTL
jgi:hypothetical protein